MTTAWSIARPSRSDSVASVAWRGSNGVARRSALRAIAAASGPLSRTTPIPPRPGGVAIATMVSSVENIGATDGASLATAPAV